MSDQSIKPQPVLDSRSVDLTGREPFGRLTVLRFTGYVLSGGQGCAAWLCRCECGTEKVILAGNLTSGGSRSCGCVTLEKARLQKTNLKHGKHGSPEYRIWHGMKRRCLGKSYRNYGGRGIRVCARWRGRGGFVNFLTDVGERPSPEHSLERIDNDGDYEPGNVKWGTRFEQNRNRRTNVWLTHGGETLCARDWAKRVGLNHQTLAHRLAAGWSVEQALTTPKGQRPQ